MKHNTKSANATNNGALDSIINVLIDRLCVLPIAQHNKYPNILWETLYGVCTVPETGVSLERSVRAAYKCLEDKARFDSDEPTISR